MYIITTPSARFAFNDAKTFQDQALALWGTPQMKVNFGEGDIWVDDYLKGRDPYELLIDGESSPSHLLLCMREDSLEEYRLSIIPRINNKT